MQAKSTRVIVLLMLVVLGTAWLFTSLLGKRFSSGSDYPAYSTLRSDPLGAKALYQSLSRLPELQVSRNFREFRKLETQGKTALLLLNVSPLDWKRAGALETEELRHFAARGGRLIVCLGASAEGLERLHDDAQERREEREKKEEQDAGKEKSAKDDNAKDKKKEEEEKEESKPASEVFGMTLSAKPFVLTKQGGKPLHWFEANPVLEEKALPLWYGGAALDMTQANASQWRVVATVNTDPVIAERKIGQGSIILLTDSYFASNEALWKEPAPEFLAWLIGDSGQIIFDETHLGTRLQDGIMSLVYRFRLQGLFVGALLVFLLFVWQSGSSLIPQQNQKPATEVVSGQGAVAGMMSLLRRGVPRKKLLSAGLDAWQKGKVTKNAATEMRLQAAYAVVDEAAARPLKRDMLKALYQQISGILHPSASSKTKVTTPEQH